LPEALLRGTLTDVPAVPRGTLHALELAHEDITKWCGGLADDELNATPAGLAPVAFHLRHIARSLDRLLTYAEGRQLAALNEELGPRATREELFGELNRALESSAARLRALAIQDLESPRVVGKKRLPTTLGGLLVHIADHTLRHTGQAITTTKVIMALRGNRAE